jgi:hypothetical protein
VEPSLGPIVAHYLAMAAGPDVLAAAEPRVRALLEAGWRPTPVGPTPDEISGLAAVA